MRCNRGCNLVLERRSAALTSIRFICFVVISDSVEKLFSHWFVVENIINSFTAFSLRDGYSLSSDIQNCASDCILYIDNRVASQHNSIRHSISQEL